MKTITLAFPIALLITLALMGFIVTLFAIVDILRDQKDKYKNE
tara:strand:+ start:314 stop:442 length:129 start_codon:yes stop_codon:yes gene_type:complete